MVHFLGVEIIGRIHYDYTYSGLSHVRTDVQTWTRMGSGAASVTTIVVADGACPQGINPSVRADGVIRPHGWGDLSARTGESLRTDESARTCENPRMKVWGHLSRPRYIDADGGCSVCAPNPSLTRGWAPLALRGRKSRASLHAS
jgi:hypothetical protein